MTHRTLPTPVGPVTVAVDAAGALTRVDFADTPGGAAPGVDVALDRAVAQLEEYFVGVRTDFDLPIAAAGTVFQQRVWTALRDIPYGATESYGSLARRLGAPGASRAVGLANGRNPIAIVVPCHRVIGSSGTLTGYAGGIERKRWLLDHEAGTSRLPSAPGAGLPAGSPDVGARHPARRTLPATGSTVTDSPPANAAASATPVT